MRTEVKVEDGYYIVKIPVAESYSDPATRRYLDGLRLQRIASRSQASKEQIEALATEMKATWWENNKEWFLHDLNR